jgi:hypothetical protein
MHANAWIEFHIIWHRRRSIVATRRYTTGSRRIPIYYRPGRVNDRSDAAGPVIAGKNNQRAIMNNSGVAPSRLVLKMQILSQKRERVPCKGVVEL